MHTPYLELHLHTPYSFRDGGSEIESLVARAAELGMPALAMTDHDNTAASVKFATACHAYGIKPILGAEITMEDGSHLTLLARNRQGYAQLCTLISRAYAHGGRLTPSLPWAELYGCVGGWVCGCEDEGKMQNAKCKIASPPLPLSPSPPLLLCLSGCRKGLIPSLVAKRKHQEAEEAAARLRDTFGAENFYIELQNDLTPGCDRVNRQLAELADRIGVRVVATNNVHYATRADFVAHDILRCIAAGCKREEVHPDRPLNAERYLKGTQEMAELFSWRPDAPANTRLIAEQCEFALPDPGDVTPRYPVPEGKGNAEEYLRYLVYKGAKSRYGMDVWKYGSMEGKSDAHPHFHTSTRPYTIATRIEHELRIICDLGYADYFLMCWEIVRWARKQGIRATGRGSAADSCVAYCLTLTDVDVIQRNLPFARFLAEGKIPDIDIDFPSERRDDVFQYILQKYGEEHVGMVCTFHTYWAKSAVRDIGKVLSIPQEALSWLSDNLSGFIRADQVEEAFGRFAELRPWASMKDRFKLLFELSGKIAGFPRHIATHSSGIVISRVPLGEIAPLQPSARGITQIWELDKDDAEMLGAIKFDVLALRMLSAVGDAEKMLERTSEAPPLLASELTPTHGEACLRRLDESATADFAMSSRDLSRPGLANPKSKIQNPKWAYDRIPFGDEETFRMMRAGKAVGAFQFESAAQMSLATTLNPEHFEDLVAAVALIRPGPIQGHVVQRFVACRNGWMKADMLHPCLRITLAKTYGCIVFQEQVNDVVATMTGCSDAEADCFRKSITQHTKQGTMQQLRDGFVRKSCAYRRDFDEDRANKLFDQIQGWAGYGFTEGHAASFALTGYRTAYLTVHHPAEIYAGMMNHQPMGFFSSNTLAGEARRRGVRILPVDINESGDKCCAVQMEEECKMQNAKCKIQNEDVTPSPTLPLSPSDPGAIRLGLRLVSELREADTEHILAARQEGPFASLLDFCARVPIHRNSLENLILCGAFDSLHEHRRGLLWRLGETMALAATYRGGERETGRGGENAKCILNTLDQSHHASRITHHVSASVSPSPSLPLSLSLNLGSARSIATPIAWDIDDFSPWDKFMWTWRLTGVTAEAHVFAWMREKLRRKGVMTAYEAQRQKPGTRVTVAGLNIRPHRPRTVSGNPVLFTIVEDETEMLQTSVFGDAIWETTTVFLTSPAVIVRGKIERRGRGSSLMLEKAMPLRFQDFAEEDGEPIATPPAQRTYTGTKIHAHNPAAPAPLAPA